MRNTDKQNPEVLDFISNYAIRKTQPSYARPHTIARYSSATFASLRVNLAKTSSYPAPKQYFFC